MTSQSDSYQKHTAVPYPWQVSVWDRLCQQAQDNQLSHALLVYGESGLGKIDLARELADFLLCQNPGAKAACGQCRMCQLGCNRQSSDAEPEQAISQQPDLLLVEASTNSGIITVEQVRELIELVTKTSHSGGRKVVIINQADGLNINASNALLKTLEEPTANTFIILVTDLPGRMLATIRSRCQKVEIPKPAAPMGLQWLNSVTDFADAATVLEACSGRPLLARTAIETGEAGLRVEFLEVLSHLINGSLTPTEFLGKTNHLQDRVVVDFLSYTSSILVKYLLSDNKVLLTGSALKGLVQILIGSGRPRQSLCKDLLNLYKEAESARKQLQGGANPNPQLLKESLLWHWSGLVQSPPRRNSVSGL